jgi:propanol-preferring alcohol dehydrogenase
MENLCDQARFTGYTLPGGYAEFLPVDERFCLTVEESCDPVATAPLLCGGLIGYRALRMTGDARRVGLYGFGAAAHILAQVLNYQGKSCYAFTRPGDRAAQALAREIGADWAGDSNREPDQPLDAAIIFAPVGALVPIALRHVRKGGVVVCGGIHMSDIPSFPYQILWGERQLRSVANLTRSDGIEFLALAAAARIHTHTREFPLEQANLALEQLRSGELTGSAVLRIHNPASRGGE